MSRNERALLLTGFMATLAGLGLARFAYTALMPQMVLARWFSGEQVAYLGAANLLGYLIGALAASALAGRFGALRVLAACWIAVALSFAACAAPLPWGAMAWFFAWRWVSGAAGAILLVLGTSVALAAAAPQRRAALGPLVFCGVGTGALLSALCIGPLARHSLSAVWCLLALLCAAAGWLGWRAGLRLEMPSVAPVAPPQPVMQPVTPRGTSTAAPAIAAVLWRSAPVLLLIAAYMCDAFGFVPHTVFWVDYLARERALGATYASTQWAIFGLGAICGPLAAALCATRWGWWGTVSGAYLLKTCAIALPLFFAGFAGHAISSFLVGALSPGMAAITSGYLMHLVGPARHKALWGWATAAFALMQASSGYFMAWRYASSGSYHGLFGYGALALLAGTLMVWGSRRIKPGISPG